MEILSNSTTKNSGTKTVATTDQLWTIQAGGVDVPAKSGKVNLVAGDHITITPDAANGKMTISATGFGSMDGFNVKHLLMQMAHMLVIQQKTSKMVKL